MTLEIEYKSDSTLLIHYSPDHSSSLSGLGLSLVFTAFGLLIGATLSLFGIIAVSLLIWFTADILRKRELRCVLDRETGMITYTKCGIFGSQYDVQNSQYNLTEIIALETRRYVRRRQPDVFQIRLTLVGNRTLPLSFADLDFHDCQSSASKIHPFIGVDIPLRAID